MNLRVLPPVFLCVSMLACSSGRAAPKFNVSDIAASGREFITCDLDGDGLKDMVVIDDGALTIFFQDPRRGFTRQPQQSCPLEYRQCVVSAARLGGAAESLLFVHREGVAALRFTNRTDAPARRQIISQPTIIPDSSERTNVSVVTFSAVTGRDWPLLLVPAEDGLEVWQHRDEWRQAQVIGQAVDARQTPAIASHGYRTSLACDWSVGDVNEDGRDDLMIRRRGVGRTNIYCLYLQQTNGLFAPEPALTYRDEVESFSWHCWVDLNRDGREDLVKSVWLNEPSFVPGIPAGKVFVRTYIADANGRIPAEPQQVLRKNDWLAALPVVDVDGDGFLDFVLGYGRMDSREGLRKEITARKLDYSIQLYFYRPGAGFPKEGDCQRDLVLHLDRPEGPLDWNLPQNFPRCVNLRGDFNGDGKADLLVRDRSDDISVYFFVSRTRGFSADPDVRLRCPEPVERWQVADLNHDGVSDLIVKLAGEKGYRIFLSRK